VGLPADHPKVGIDGDRPVRASWGRWSTTVPGDNHLVRVSVRWYSGEVAPAQAEVYVPPGGEVTIHYRTPPSLGGRGAIGHTPRSTPGPKPVLIVLLILAILVLYLVMSLLFG